MTEAETWDSRVGVMMMTGLGVEDALKRAFRMYARRIEVYDGCVLEKTMAVTSSKGIDCVKHWWRAWLVGSELAAN